MTPKGLNACEDTSSRHGTETRAMSRRTGTFIQACSGSRLGSSSAYAVKPMQPLSSLIGTQARTRARRGTAPNPDDALCQL